MIDFTKRVLAFLLRHNADELDCCIACEQNRVEEKDCSGFYSIGLSYLLLAYDLFYSHKQMSDYEVKILWDKQFKGYIPQVTQIRKSKKIIECLYANKSKCLFAKYLCDQNEMPFKQNYIPLNCDLDVDFDFDTKLCFIREGIVGSEVGSELDKYDLYALYALYINNVSWLLHDNDKAKDDENNIRFDKVIDSLFKLGLCLNPKAFLKNIKLSGNEEEFNYLLDIYIKVLNLQKNVIKFRENNESNNPFPNYFNNLMITELNEFLGLSLVTTCRECDKVLSNEINIEKGRYGDLRKNISDFKPDFNLFAPFNLNWRLKRKLKKAMKMYRKNEKDLYK